MTGFDALWAFERYDGFVLDAFGVINVGETAIAGAADGIAGLQALGKTVLVVTNGATTPGEATAAKYAKMGLPLTRREVISSRDALALALAEEDVGVWGFAATEASELEQFGTPFSILGEDPEDYRRAEGFVLLSSIDWNEERQALLAEALAERPRPLLVGNPDLVAPREWGFSAEPGHSAHLLADAGLAA
ncbi:MAG: TIGR01459 family HAD-type hydrolase, partial [Limibacillus sp.]